MVIIISPTTICIIIALDILIGPTTTLPLLMILAKVGTATPASTGLLGLIVVIVVVAVAASLLVIPLLLIAQPRHIIIIIQLLIIPTFLISLHFIVLMLFLI